MEDWIEVVIRDWNRVVNWIFPPDTPLADVLSKWEKGYHPFDRERVIMHGAIVPEEMFGCFLSSFTEDKALIILRTKFPKKRKEEDEDVG